MVTQTSHTARWNIIGIGNQLSAEDSGSAYIHPYYYPAYPFRASYVVGWNRMTLVERLNAPDTFTIERTLPEGGYTTQAGDFPDIAYLEKDGLQRTIGVLTDVSTTLGYERGRPVRRQTGTYNGLYGNLFDRLALPTTTDYVNQNPTEAVKLEDGTLVPYSNYYPTTQAKTWNRTGKGEDVVLRLIRENYSHVDATEDPALSPGAIPSGFPRGYWDIFAMFLKVPASQGRGKTTTVYPSARRVGDVITGVLEDSNLKLAMRFNNPTNSYTGWWEPVITPFKDKSQTIRFGQVNDASLGTITAFEHKRSRRTLNMPITEQNFGSGEVRYTGASLAEEIGRPGPAGISGQAFAAAYVEQAFSIDYSSRHPGMTEEDAQKEYEAQDAATSEQSAAFYDGQDKDEFTFSVQLSGQLEVGRDITTGDIVGVSIVGFGEQESGTQVIREIETTVDGNTGEKVEIRCGNSATVLNTVRPQTVYRLVQEIKKLKGQR